MKFFSEDGMRHALSESVSVSRILLLARLPIGDTLFVEPTVRALRARYPRASIVALTAAGAAPVWACIPAIDEVVTLPVGRDWQGPRALLRVLLDLRRRDFDVAVDFTSPAYKFVSLFAGIPRRTYMKFDRLWWSIPRSHVRWRAMHATRHYYDCARELDLPAWDRVDRIPRLQLPRSAYSSAAAFLRWRGVDGRRALVGVHAGGAGLSGLKRWPAASFAAVADRLVMEHDAQIMLLGGPEERDIATAVFERMRCPSLDAVGRVPLLGSFALVAACDLFIGNDSSLLHAAAALGTPYVGIIGPTATASFRPVPSRRGQGRLVQPEPACFEPTFFVGSSLIWQRPRCRGCCAALAVVPPQHVVDAALQLPRRAVPGVAAAGITSRR